MTPQDVAFVPTKYLAAIVWVRTAPDQIQYGTAQIQTVLDSMLSKGFIFVDSKPIAVGYDPNGYASSIIKMIFGHP